MGFFSGLDTERYDRRYSDRQLVARLGSYFRPYWRSLVVIFILVLILAVTGAATPVVVSRGVDELKTKLSSSAIAVLSGIVLAAGLLNWASNWLRRRLVVRIIGDIILTLRTDAFRASAEHDLSFYDQYSSGRVVSRITSDTQEFGNTVVLITDLFSQIAQAILLGAILVSIEWKLSLIVFGILPFLFLVAFSFRQLARRVTRIGMRAMANVNAAIKETISGIAVAKNFRQEGAIFTEFDDANRQSYRVNVQRGLLLSIVFPVLNVLGGFGSAILVYSGGLSAAQGAVSAGAWFLFLQSLDRFFFPVQNLSAFWAQVQSGLSAAERVFGLIDAESQVKQVADRPVPRLRGDIRFEHVDFRYQTEVVTEDSSGEEGLVARQQFKETISEETPARDGRVETESSDGSAPQDGSEQEDHLRIQVLQDFDLHILPGETIALVGHTGAGKSSIAKLIARFYEFQGGRILIDGQDIRTFDLNQYRRQLGIVSQVPFLFSGTVVENICYACPEVDRDWISQMARQIGDGEWLETLPQGLDTEVGERGNRLSMGQRQLVSLMRVLVQRPAVFILDEATASVDPFTEWQIQQALNLILEKSTSILIAHRLSTVKAADRIIVLEKGRIIEEGDHEGLLSQGGHYASLYNTYFRHQSLDYKPPDLEEELRLRQELQDKMAE